MTRRAVFALSLCLALAPAAHAAEDVTDPAAGAPGIQGGAEDITDSVPVLAYPAAPVWYTEAPDVTDAPDTAAGQAESAGAAPDASWYSEGGAADGMAGLLQQIEEEEAAARREKEALIRMKVSLEMEKSAAALSQDDPLYFVTTDQGTDYAVAVKDGIAHPYYVMISKKGDYFVSDDGMSEEEAAAAAAGAVPEALSSTENFWNKVALMYTEGATVSQLPRDGNGVLCVPYFNQGAGYWNGSDWEYTFWPDVTFDVNGHTMHEAGCGFFSTAMALSYVRQEIVAPVDFKENGQYIAGLGSAVTVGVETAKMYGVNAYITGDINEVIQALRDGHPVMEHVGQSIFTGGGHYILLVGVLPDGTIAVNDPGHKDNTYWYSGVSHSVGTIVAAEKSQPSYTVFG